MPVYQYRCSACSVVGETFRKLSDDPMVTCPECGKDDLRRLYSFSLQPVMHEHFNHSVGELVSGRRDFAEKLRRKSEEASEQTGIPHNYVPVDLSDSEGLNVTEEGMDSTLRRRTETGQREVKKWH